MADFLRYDGQTLFWEDGKTRKEFKASSGIYEVPEKERVFRVGNIVYRFLEDYRWSWYEKYKDHGPIPSGTYTVESAILKQPWSEYNARTCDLKVAWGIQKIPRGDPNPAVKGDQPTQTTAGDCEPYWANWGSNRVRLSPHKDMVAPDRAGFYIHDSVKGFSHGCIETEQDFFVNYLVPYATKNPNKRFYIGVKYKHERTYGGTLIGGGAGHGIKVQLSKSVLFISEQAQTEAIIAFRDLCVRLKMNAPLKEESADATGAVKKKGVTLDPPPQSRLMEYTGAMNLRFGANDVSKDPKATAMIKGWWETFV